MLGNNPDSEERRKTARLDVPIKVQYKISNEDSSNKTEADLAKQNGSGITKDVSAGGCLLLTTEDLPINSEVDLEIFLSDSANESLRLKGRIARLNRAEKGLYEFGIDFDNLSREARRLFADYFFAKMYEMIGLPDWPTDKRSVQ